MKLSHINSLRNFLLTTRQAYMQIGPSRFQPRPSSIKNQDLVSLTDKQRDEIDFEAKTIIRQTMDRVKTLETLEKGNNHILSAVTSLLLGTIAREANMNRTKK